jgi:hypothetical protein
MGALNIVCNLVATLGGAIADLPFARSGLTVTKKYEKIVLAGTGSLSTLYEQADFGTFKAGQIVVDPDSTIATATDTTVYLEIVAAGVTFVHKLDKNRPLLLPSNVCRATVGGSDGAYASIKVQSVATANVPVAILLVD